MLNKAKNKLLIKILTWTKIFPLIILVIPHACLFLWWPRLLLKYWPVYGLGEWSCSIHRIRLHRTQTSSNADLYTPWPHIRDSSLHRKVQSVNSMKSAFDKVWFDEVTESPLLKYLHVLRPVIAAHDLGLAIRPRQQESHYSLEELVLSEVNRVAVPLPVMTVHQSDHIVTLR